MKTEGTTAHRTSLKDLRIAAFRSSSITLALVFTVLLVVSIATLLYFMELASDSNKRNEIASIIETDVQGLVDAHRVGGIEGLVDILQYRLKHPEIGHIYALANQQNTVMLGNFGYMPEDMPPSMEMFELPLEAHPHKDSGLPTGREYRILATHMLLSDGYHLMVGRNMPDVKIKQQLIDRLGWAVIGLLVFLAAAGFFIGDRVVYRINLIADTAAYIMHTGDLSRRIPVPGKWDDLSKLAFILNELFTRIEYLMEEVRQVSDNIAHDLRTPLTRLKNQLELLHKRVEEQQLPTTDCTEKLLQEAEHILETFSALLRIRNLEAGKWRVENEPVALDGIIADVVEFYEPLAQEKEQEISMSADNVTLQGDKHLLFQAVANLLDNAIKYAPEYGHIMLTLNATKEKIMFEVMNTGSMVEEEYLEKIFQRFFRTDKARQSKAGNGLGLSLVKAIVTHHRGSISALNTDEGFKISIVFPV